MWFILCRELHSRLCSVHGSLVSSVPLHVPQGRFVFLFVPLIMFLRAVVLLVHLWFSGGVPHTGFHRVQPSYCPSMPLCLGHFLYASSPCFSWQVWHPSVCPTDTLGLSALFMSFLPAWLPSALLWSLWHLLCLSRPSSVLIPSPSETPAILPLITEGSLFSFDSQPWYMEELFLAYLLKWLQKRKVFPSVKWEMDSGFYTSCIAFHGGC